MDIAQLREDLGELVIKDSTYVFENTGLDYYKLNKDTANQIMDYLCDNDDEYMFYLLIRACQVYCIRLIHAMHFATHIPLEDINQEMALHVKYVIECWKKRRDTDNPIKNSLQYVSFRLRDVNRNRYGKDYNLLGQDKLEYRMEHLKNTVLNIGGKINSSFVSITENENKQLAKYGTDGLYDYVLRNYGSKKAYILFNKNLGFVKSITGSDLTNDEIAKEMGLSTTKIKKLTKELKEELKVDKTFIDMLKEDYN